MNTDITLKVLIGCMFPGMSGSTSRRVAEGPVPGGIDPGNGMQCNAGKVYNDM